MVTRLTAFLLSILSLLFVASIAQAAEDAKSTKKMIRAGNGVEISCEVRGQGDSALVLLHGWCGTRELARPWQTSN